jgi:hypothetical protein
MQLAHLVKTFANIKCSLICTVMYIKNTLTLR